MDTDKYHGWTNRATWCVHLWITNEERSYRTMTAMCQEAPDAGTAAEYLKERHEEAILDPVLSGMSLDLLQSVLDSVNWLEIANALRTH